MENGIDSKIGKEVKSSAILRERARKLAREAKNEETDGFMEVVEFRIGEEQYAVGSLHVGEVFPVREITPVPCTPSFVAGIVNLRGRIVSIVDLKVFFDIPRTDITGKSRIIILRSREMELGILTDAIAGVRCIPLRGIHPPLPTMTGVRAAYLLGLAGEDLVVLDGAKLLGDVSLVVNEEV
jgi:purine-binding chemotaxis protein CheW